jgi:lipoyl(octanoyl) transferase
MNLETIVAEPFTQDYLKIWEYQQQLRDEVLAGAIPKLLICNHFPVITKGKSTPDSAILASSQLLKNENIALIDVDRGGKITYHSTTQIICYPIINLKTKRCDVAWYMRSLEQVIIQVLTNYKINAERRNGLTGVWVNNRKIASLGVKIKRWVTCHGIALNILPDDGGFKFITPCGIEFCEVTSITEEIGLSPTFIEIIAYIIKTFKDVFDYK